MKKNLSKSRLLSFRQCPKKLYLETTHPELVYITPAQHKIFDIGHEVGEFAQRFFPQGLVLKNDIELTKASDDTKTQLANPDIKTLFEATFNHKRISIRADVLHKTANGVHIQEVKSSTSVKDVHIEDCAIQTWVIEGAGYAVDKIELTHINNQFIYEEEGNYEGFFIHESVMEKVRDLQSHIGHWVDDAFEIIAMKDEPNIQIGEQCKAPYPCPFIEHCDPVTTDYPVKNLPNGSRTAIALRNEGIFDIRDIPVDRLSSENQERVRRVTVSGKFELEPAARLEMLELGYPRYYIDFESMNFAIPRWLGTRPYQQICFQWSCHIERSFNELSHVEFLDTSGQDPSQLFIETLIEALGDHGPILVYNATFENTRMKELAERFPEHKKSISKIIARVVDLLPIARKYYYHPDMRGSWSLKMLLPTIAPELDYSELEEVHHGMEAQDAYLEAISPETKQERKEQLKQHLLKYCEMDTIAMVKIAHFFEQGGS